MCRVTGRPCDWDKRNDRMVCRNCHRTIFL